jgi:hypothetical protein
VKGSHRRGRCENCDYDLSDILGVSTCPECGVRFDLRRPTRRPLLRQSRFGQSIAALGIGCPLALIGGSAVFRWHAILIPGLPQDAVIASLVLVYFVAVITLLIAILWISLIPRSERPRVGWIAILLLAGIGASWVLLATR